MHGAVIAIVVHRVQGSRIVPDRRPLQAAAAQVAPGSGTAWCGTNHLVRRGLAVF